MRPCVFCEIVAGAAPATVLQSWDEAIMIVPLNPLTPGHRLILPRVHVADAATDPATTAAVAYRAAETVCQGEHLAVNVGAAAGMTIEHLHWHVWPCIGGTACMPWGCPAAPHRPTPTRNGR